MAPAGKNRLTGECGKQQSPSLPALGCSTPATHNFLGHKSAELQQILGSRRDGAGERPLPGELRAELASSAGGSPPLQVWGLSGYRARRAKGFFKENDCWAPGFALVSAGLGLLPRLATTSEGISLGNGLKENQRGSRYQHGLASGAPPRSNRNGFAQRLAEKLLFRELELELGCDTY